MAGKIIKHETNAHPHFELSFVPKNPLVIEGFPSFGLIGTIVTEYLMEHLKVERIGTFFFRDLPATVAIHDGKIVPPIAIY